MQVKSLGRPFRHIEADMMRLAKKFKRVDVRPLLAKGVEPLLEIRRRVEALRAEEGLVIVAPFLPAPLIERLGSEGFQARLEHGSRGEWIIYFWRDNG